MQCLNQLRDMCHSYSIPPHHFMLVTESTNMKTVVHATCKWIWEMWDILALKYFSQKTWREVFISKAQKPNSVVGHLMVEVSRSHTHTHTQVGLLWTKDQPFAKAATYTTQNRNKRRTSCLQGDSNRDLSIQATGDLRWMVSYHIENAYVGMLLKDNINKHVTETVYKSMDWIQPTKERNQYENYSWTRGSIYAWYLWLD
jgi:hypothetical protein